MREGILTLIPTLTRTLTLTLTPHPIPNKERLEALLVAAYDEIRADLSGDAARRGKLEAHCERLELESRMAWQHLRRIAGSHPGEP